jgi:hypothetical protein
MAAARARDTDAPRARPRNDAYTGMLIISLLAMILGCVLLFLDYSSYSGKPATPPPRAANPPAGTPGPRQ